MYRQFPFFAILSEPCDVLLDASGRVSTACVNEHGRIWISAEFADSLTDLQLAFVLAHEVSHVAFGHFARRGSRDPLAWNIANDFVINLLLSECFADSRAVPPGALLDPKYAGMTSEQVYELLMRKARRLRVTWGGPDMVVDGLCGDMPHDAIVALAARGVILSANGWATELARAAARARMAGNLSDGIQRAVNQCIKPKVDWVTQLRQYLSQEVCREGRNVYTFVPCSRRHIAQGTYLPSLVGQGSPRVGFAIDTSGSMDEDDIAAAHAEIDSIRRQYACPMYVMSADMKVWDGEWVDPYGPLPMPRGGGGTDFRPVFEHVVAERVPVDVIVYMTDGEGDFGQDPRIPTIWVMTTHVRPPWGHFVQARVDA